MTLLLNDLSKFDHHLKLSTDYEASSPALFKPFAMELRLPEEVAEDSKSSGPAGQEIKPRSSSVLLDTDDPVAVGAAGVSVEQ